MYYPVHVQIRPLTSFEVLHVVHLVLLTAVEVLVTDPTCTDFPVLGGIRREYLSVEEVVVAGYGMQIQESTVCKSTFNVICFT